MHTFVRRLAVLGVLAAAASSVPVVIVPHARADASEVTRPIPGTGGTVTVSKTQNLTRERVAVSWTGLKPSSTSGSFGVRFPVMILQCWGDNPTRENCLTRPTAPAWGQDLAEDNPAYTVNNGAFTLPFVARDGTRTEGTSRPTGIPDNSLPRQDAVGFTGPDGTGRTTFEVRTSVEAPSLGCTSANACSLVVVPVQNPIPVKPGKPPVSSLFANGASEKFFPYSASHWANRVVFPLGFLPTPDNACPLGVPTTPTLGSELAAEALRQWQPRFCLDNPGKVDIDYTRDSDGSARTQYAAGSQNFVFSSAALAPDATERPTVYAPVAVTSVVVGWVVDDKTTKQQIRAPMRLTPRLLAKLLTQSYVLNSIADKAPDNRGNPRSLFLDPEFTVLNPDFAGAQGLGGDVVTNVQVVVSDEDLVWEVTRYIAADPEARAWLAGDAGGPGGVRVNGRYRGWRLPVHQFEWREDYVCPTRTSVEDPNPLLCSDSRLDGQNPYDLSAQRLTDLSLLGENLLYGRSASNTLYDDIERRWKASKEPPAPGLRATIAIMDLPTALKYDVPVAQLRNAAGQFVAPDTNSMGHALSAMPLNAAKTVREMDYTNPDPSIYPLTMPVYGIAATSGLTSKQAGDYALLLEHAADRGQLYGSGPGDLPAGYFTLPETLRTLTAQAADAVRNQTGTKPQDPGDPIPPPPNTPNGGGGNNGGGGGGGTGGDNTGGGGGTGAPTPTPSRSGSPATAPDQVRRPGATPSPAPNVQPVARAVTRADRTGLFGWAIVIVFGLGLAATVAIPVVRAANDPDHPIRRLPRRLRGGGAR